MPSSGGSSSGSSARSARGTSGAVQEQPPQRARSLSSTTSLMEQRSDRSPIDPADPLDRRLRHGLAVGHDRQRLERRRQGDRPPRRIGDRAPPSGAVAARPGRHRSAADARSRNETSRSPRRASTVARSVPASVAISRRVSGFSTTNSKASARPPSARSGRARGGTVGWRDVLGESVTSTRHGGIDSTGSPRTIPAIRRSARRPRAR